MGYTKVSNWPIFYSVFGQKSKQILMQDYNYLQNRIRKPSRRTAIWAVVVAAIAVTCVVSLVLVFSHLTAPSVTQLAVRNGTPLIPAVTTPGHSYGIAAGGSLASLSDQELDQRMAGIAASGAKWVRFDFNWGNIQPDNATSFQWDEYDKLVAAAQKNHLYTLGILTYTPEWARASICKDSDKCQPADNQQFADFAAAVAHRYKDKGLHYWEVWNEPNNPQFWQPGANPTAYAHLLQQATTALRSEDQQAYIITAGLSPQATTKTSFSPIDFLTAFYKVASKDSFNAVADHPYTFPLSPKDTADHAWSQMVSTKSSLRQIMVANGDSDKKLWITEFGSPTGGPGPVSTINKPNLNQHPYVVDEALQSKILSDAVSLYTSYDWTGPFFYYSYQDAGNTPDTNENYFGLLRYDGSKKPAYQTFRDAATNNSY